MTILKKVSTAMFLTMIIFLSVTRVNVNAATVNTKQEIKYFVGIKDKRTDKYPFVTLYLGNKYIKEKAYLINDTTYIPLRAVSEISGATVAYDSKTRTASVIMQGLSMSVTDGSYITYANERPIISKSPAVILSDGRMYVPVRSIAKAFSLGVQWHSDRRVVLSGTVKPLLHADKYYKSDEIFWLSRIISAESQGEPLLGQIAVGNVVINRVRSRDFPNTIYGVVFDRKYGIQFTPVANGSIYNTPTYSSTIAAKICLEGFSLDEKMLFFMEPTKSTSSWIKNNRKYAFSIENHDFYY